VPLGGDLCDRLAGLHRQAVPRDVTFQHADELVAGHCPFRIVAVVAVARHDRQHPGDVEAEGVPTLRAPGLADARALEDDMPRPGLAEAMAHSETRPARTDDHRVEDITHPATPKADAIMSNRSDVRARDGFWS